MPFITEEIWQAIPHEGDALMVQDYPVFSEALSFPVDAQRFETVMDAIKAVRARRAEMNVPPSRKAHLMIVTREQPDFEVRGVSFEPCLGEVASLLRF
jgi:valyl-tRNA synthetase